MSWSHANAGQRTYDDKMAMPRVYVETTIPSFYHEGRSEPAIIARRDWTRQWWAIASSRYELVTSPAVLDDLANGPTDRVDDWLELMRPQPVVAVTMEIASIVSSYLQDKVMPADPAGDALYLALASHHKCDFLVTWHCQHLANAHKFGHIRRVNAMLGLFVRPS